MAVASIALTIVTGGAPAPILAMAIMGIVTGIAAIVGGVFEILQGIRDLQTVEKRFELNKLVALVEKMKIDLEVMTQDIDVLIEMFESKMSDVRAEYDKAARMLKEHCDTKRMIAQNFKAWEVVLTFNWEICK
jgi:hypothetical protein